MPPHGDPHHPGDAPAAAPADGAAAVDALAVMLPLVHTELRAAAARLLWREGPGHTLQPTELVHEAYFKLIDQRDTDFQNRAHFYAIAARLIRRVLIDQVRERQAQKRGGEQVHVSLNHALDADAPEQLTTDDLIDVDRMLGRLERIRERAARIVELRYFTGLSIEETAEVCGISLATAKREWAFARAWMQDQLGTSG